MSSTNRNDALGYLNELREAILSPSIRILLPEQNGVDTSTLRMRWESSMQIAEKSRELRDTAVAVVSALGFCRLYGISLPSDLNTRLHTPLPVELLAPAISGMLRLLESSTNDARTLPSRFDGSEPFEDRSHCTSILHSLMELWAMYIVLDDEYQYSLERSKDPCFCDWIHQVLDAFSALDNEVQCDEQLRLLSVATELPLLENWRKMLAPPFREHLPWWLDGTLEASAKEVRQLVETDQTFTRLVSPPRLNAKSQSNCETRESTLSITTYLVELPRAFNSVRNEFLHGQAASPMRESPCESRRYAIMGDPESSARVSLEIDSSDRTRDVIFVELIRSALAYTAVSVHFSDGTSTAMEFDGQTGRLSVIAGINSFQIKLVDVSGGEHILTPKEV